MSPGIKINLWFRSQYCDCVIPAGMFAHEVGNSDGFDEWTLTVNHSARFNWRSFEEELLVRHDRQPQTCGNQDKKDEHARHSASGKNVGQCSNGSASKQRHCRKNENEIVMAEIQSRGKGEC